MTLKTAKYGISMKQRSSFLKTSIKLTNILQDRDKKKTHRVKS